MARRAPGLCTARSIQPRTFRGTSSLSTIWDTWARTARIASRRLQNLLIRPAREWPEGRFAVAGPQYPASIHWPANVTRIDHLPPSGHCRFYNSQRFTLNVTRADMCEAGYSPSVRLFEAAACGTPIISDYWPGLETIFDLQEEILVEPRRRADAELPAGYERGRQAGRCTSGQAASARRSYGRSSCGPVRAMVDALLLREAALLAISG